MPWLLLQVLLLILWYAVPMMAAVPTWLIMMPTWIILAAAALVFTAGFLSELNRQSRK